MKQISLLLVFILSLARASDGAGDKDGSDDEVCDKDGSKELEKLQGIVSSLGRQMMMQQLYMEETARSGMSSGIKQKRVMRWGTKAYDTDSHTGNAFMSIHNHENIMRTVGLGEFIAVLNGIEFRTRHNDYKLVMPHTTSPTYHATEDIPFPDVPPSVLQHVEVKDQIKEMQMYFKAWAEQDTKIRDYRPYFKPVLCYMEGAWTQSGKTIDEPFDSDRHQIDAESWFDLTEKVRFTGNTGSKSNAENYAYLPTKIMELQNGTYPIFAQWNYRILCHPVSKDIPLKQFRVVDDLAPRMSVKKTLEKFSKSRAARFQLNPKPLPRNSKLWLDNKQTYGLLDELMGEIPGKDNYHGNLTDDAFNNPVYPKNRDIMTPLNTAFYHRWYRNERKGAMGQTVRNRGFSDKNVFMAQTSNKRVRSSKVTDCEKINGKKVCDSWEQRWSYAIPLEIIYLTPLLNWNPYDLELKSGKMLKTVNANGRSGGSTSDKAFNGTSARIYYITPSQFFEGGAVEKDPADTAKGSVGVLDRNGEVKMVHASGTRVVLPNIPDVGELRTRFPIAPITSDGTFSYQEVEALKELVMNMRSYSHMVNEQVVEGNGAGPDSYMFETSVTSQDPPGLHKHTVEIGIEDMAELIHHGKVLTLETSVDNGHSHTIKLKYNKYNTMKPYRILEFDGKPVDKKNNKSWDGHLPNLIVPKED